MTTNLEARQAHVNVILGEMKAGFHVEYAETWKNNCIRTGYTLIADGEVDKKVCPLLYLPSDSNGSDESLARFLVEKYKEIPRPRFEEAYTSRSYVVENIYPKVVSRKNLPEIKAQKLTYKEEMDMLVLLYIDVEVPDEDARGSINVKHSFLKMIDITEEAAFVLAFANLRKKVSAMSMEAALFDLTGCSVPENQKGSDLWVVTNTNRMQGAAAMYDEGTLSYLETIFSSSVIVLPSSVHEFIACPFVPGVELEHLLDIVKEINSSMVDTEELLTDNVYIYSKGVLKEAFVENSIAQLF